MRVFVALMVLPAAGCSERVVERDPLGGFVARAELDAFQERFDKLVASSRAAETRQTKQRNRAVQLSERTGAYAEKTAAVAKRVAAENEPLRASKFLARSSSATSSTQALSSKRGCSASPPRSTRTSRR